MCQLAYFGVWANLTPFLLQAKAPQLAAERQLGGATPVPVGAPAAPANIFETLWTAAPLKAGAAKGTVEVDLSSLPAAALPRFYGDPYRVF